MRYEYKRMNECISKLKPKHCYEFPPHKLIKIHSLLATQITTVLHSLRSDNDKLAVHGVHNKLNCVNGVT